MKLFTRKVRLFCVSNIMVSFVCTGFLGMNNYQGNNNSTTLNAHEISLASSDTEPASQYGEGEDSYFALVTNGVKAVIDQQESALGDMESVVMTCSAVSDTDNVCVDENDTGVDKEETSTKTASTKKTTSTKKSSTSTKKTTTKKTTTKTTSTTNNDKTTSVVAKKEVSKPKTQPKATGSANGESLVAYAKKFLKLKYRSGVPSLTKGADCSGFTMLIFREYGVSLPRTVGGQAKKGTAVSKSNLQKGDLVFFKPKGCKRCGLSHVAIYIGGGQVIHETRPGRGVAITRVDGLSNIQYVTARRVLKSGSSKTTEKKVEEQTKTVTDKTSKTVTSTSTPEIKNEGNVDNKNVVKTTATPTPVVKQEVNVAATPVAEKKIEVKEEVVKKENKEESNQ